MRRVRQYEDELERRLRLHEQESRACAIFAYTELAIHELAGRNADVFDRINEHAAFWNGTLAGLQTAAFIALGRIYDSDRSTDNALELLSYAENHPGLFLRESLRTRKLRDGLDADAAAHFVEGAFEAKCKDFGSIRGALTKQREVYVEKIEPLQHKQFAHAGRLERAQRDALFNALFKRELEGLAVFAVQLYRAISHLYYSGHEPVIDDAPSVIGQLLDDPVGKRVSTWEHRHVVTDTARFIASLSPASANGDLEHDAALLRGWAISTPLVRRIWLFGSRVKNEHRDDSDLDVAIEHDAVSDERDPNLKMFDIGPVVRRWRAELQPYARLKLDVWSYSRGIDTALESYLAEASRLIFERNAQVIDVPQT